jgi:DNA replication protein DnaC
MLISKEELESMDLNRNCEKHGPYQAQTLVWIDDRIMVHEVCMACTTENRVEEEEAKEKENRALHERARKDNLLDRGISPRCIDLSLSDITPPVEQCAVHKSLTAYLEARSTSSLILAGTVGTGKTYLAQALAQDLSAMGKSFIFSTARQVVRDIRSTWSRDSRRTEDQVIAAYVNTAYLFIDEVGIQYGTESEQIAMFDIINGRYENQRPTILITNLDIAGLKEIMGERIIDRLRQDGGQLLAFNWQSLRK